MNIKTRFLILSDTHAGEVVLPNLPVDVAIHCGDLTDESKMDEFRTSLKFLRAINAPLKLVIAGNHDFTLDTPVFRKIVAGADASITPGEIERVYGDFGNAEQLLAEASRNGIVFLSEGIHHFDLQNGASLTVYASPFTPSREAGGGFQFKRGEHHDFAIGEGRAVDVVITHGPPKGVLDLTDTKVRGGCEHLFAAVARARPRLHCFGHIHEGWGAKLVAWRGQPSENPSHFTDIVNGSSVLLDSLATIGPGKWDTPETILEKENRKRALKKDGYRLTSHCALDEHPLELGRKTLFVNASIEPLNKEDGAQLPWVVDIELPATSLTCN
ncbi:Metallophosphoesterase domain-containing 1 [Madurella fahalii]|uniref:Metallophosphoesterase domain-containing 1 n=1 Tax=Madurella fahalii TaxID=1157608 RepID=A0ABQ0G412_9PEZI